MRRGAGALASALVALALFYYLAVDPEYYRIRWLRGNLIDGEYLRKAYSLAAFTVLGFLIARAQRRMGGEPTIAGIATMVALCSAAIEIGQRFTGSHESFASNILDVAFGGAGGAIGAYFEKRFSASGRR